MYESMEIDKDKIIIDRIDKHMKCENIKRADIAKTLQWPPYKINELIHAVYEVEEKYPEYGLNQYGQILNEHGIEWGDRSMKAADVSEMDIQGILALLMGMVRSERFCDGSIMDLCNTRLHY